MLLPPADRRDDLPGCRLRRGHPKSITSRHAGADEAWLHISDDYWQLQLVEAIPHALEVIRHECLGSSVGWRASNTSERSYGGDPDELPLASCFQVRHGDIDHAREAKNV